MQHLHDVVGLAGANRRDDVGEVQRRLAAAHHSPGPIDRRCGRLTIGAIVAFQRRFMHEPDGRVDVDGPTWRRLRAATSSATATPRPPAAPTHPAAPPPSPRTAPATPHPSPAVPSAEGEINYTDHLPLPPRASVNVGLTSPSNRTIIAKLGSPRDSYTQECAAATNAAFVAACTTASVGPFRVTGHRDAVTSLRGVFAEVQREHPDLYAKLGTAGMLCCRYQRGSTTAVSNHAFGTAIDMKIGGVLVPRRANYAIVGLSMLAPYFNRAGWYWGATFGTPDPHHFECGSALIATFT